jgi:putative Holliday junction resolvase
VSDGDGVLATPLDTVRRGPGDVARLLDLAAAHEVVEVVVGLPLSLSGAEGAAAAAARAFAGEVATALATARGTGAPPVRMVDERLSTVSADRALREAGADGKRRRGIVDRSAAVIILQTALDAERAAGTPPGVLIAPGTITPGTITPGTGEA